MILQALNSYYQRLADQTDESGVPRMPPYGFSKEKIGYILVLSAQGKPLDAVPNMTEDKKPRAKTMAVPIPEKRSGKPSDKNMKPGFLWDKASYSLGIEKIKDKTAPSPWKVAAITFTGFRDYHLSLLQGSKDSGLLALQRFLHRWRPEDFGTSGLPEAMIDQNLVFRLDGDEGYLHERPAAKALWLDLWWQRNPEKEVPCLVSGQAAIQERLHYPIKNIWGGHPRGTSIVSFNQESFESYGKKQGDNAPVSQKAAFAYVTALNYLLDREHRQCVQIGDASTVFWALADQAGQAEAAETLFEALVAPPDDEAENHKLSVLLTAMARGRALAEIRPDLDPSTRFYVLGLAPNASRVSIRFWLEGTLGELAQRFAEHYDDLSITPVPWRKAPAIQDLLEATAVQGKTKNISPLLAGELMRAILTGAPYPMSLLAQLLLRVRAYAYKNKKNKKKRDDDLNGYRVAMIKAMIARRQRKNLIQEGVPMALDENNRNVAYLLGRLFAVLERIQGQALPELNAGISERYYGAASMVPFSVFPRLLRGARHHLGKLRKKVPGSAVYLDKALGEIVGNLPESSLPRHLSIDDQGRFAIGYYQQKQHLFTKKSETEGESA